ncbi:carboxypeptidase-like regulatory domain-containing protein [Pedobacter sp. NJ-S-72]
MQPIKLTLFFLFFFTLTKAQTKISGVLKTTKGIPVANANISLRNSYDGTSTDSTGRFIFTTSETGLRFLQYSALNFEKDSVQINLGKENITINLTIKEAPNLLQTVSISAGSFITGDKRKGAILSSMDIATIAGSRADIFAAMQSLPGAQTSFSESGLFVRGGSASETKTYFDGMLVKSPFNATVPDQASRGRLSAFLFKGTSFSAGGYSAEYGQALSSALVLESTDLPEKTTTGISLLSVGGGIDQNIRFKNSSITVGGYYYNLSPIYSLIKQNHDYVKAPEQLGGNIQYKSKTSETGFKKFMHPIAEPT